MRTLRGATSYPRQASWLAAVPLRARRAATHSRRKRGSSVAGGCLCGQASPRGQLPVLTKNLHKFTRWSFDVCPGAQGLCVSQLGVPVAALRDTSSLPPPPTSPYAEGMKLQPGWVSDHRSSTNAEQMCSTRCVPQELPGAPPVWRFAMCSTRTCARTKSPRRKSCRSVFTLSSSAASGGLPRALMMACIF